MAFERARAHRGRIPQAAVHSCPGSSTTRVAPGAECVRRAGHWFDGQPLSAPVDRSDRVASVDHQVAELLVHPEVDARSPLGSAIEARPSVSVALEIRVAVSSWVGPIARPCEKSNSVRRRDGPHRSAASGRRGPGAGGRGRAGWRCPPDRSDPQVGVEPETEGHATDPSLRTVAVTARHLRVPRRLLEVRDRRQERVRRGWARWCSAPP